MRLAKQFTALRNAGERTLVAHANQSTDEELVVERAECHLLTDLSGTAASVCMCPVQNIHGPRIISSDVYEHPVVQRFVGENTIALFWHLGNCLVDPKSMSDVLAIHGRSGVPRIISSDVRASGSATVRGREYHGSVLAPRELSSGPEGNVRCAGNTRT